MQDIQDQVRDKLSKVREQQKILEGYPEDDDGKAAVLQDIITKLDKGFGNEMEGEYDPKGPPSDPDDNGVNAGEQIQNRCDDMFNHFDEAFFTPTRGLLKEKKDPKNDAKKDSKDPKAEVQEEKKPKFLVWSSALF